jgi:hypothetical protein
MICGPWPEQEDIPTEGGQRARWPGVALLFLWPEFYMNIPIIKHTMI